MTATHNLAPFSGGSYAELRQVLSSQIQVLSPSIDQIMGFIGKFRKVDGSEVDIEVVLREALANAIVHGNREDSSKYVYVWCRCAIDGTEVSIRVQDQEQVLKAIQFPIPPARNIFSARPGAGST